MQILKECVVQIAEDWIQRIKKRPEYRHHWELWINHGALKAYDAYNFIDTKYGYLLLDNYGDDERFTTEEYKHLPKDKRVDISNARLDVLFSGLLLDEHLNAALIDIKEDLTYEIRIFKNQKSVKIPISLLPNVIGGKRAYYVDICKETYSLRFHESYENYLKDVGFENEMEKERILIQATVIEKIETYKKRQ